MQTEHLKITGMTCGGCVTSITKALESVRGVSDVKVSLATGEAAVLFDESLSSSEQLMSAVQRAGYGAQADSGARVSSHKTKGGCC